MTRVPMEVVARIRMERPSEKMPFAHWARLPRPELARWFMSRLWTLDRVNQQFL